MKPNISIKVKPTLVRKRTIVHNNIQIIVKPSARQVAPLNSLKSNIVIKPTAKSTQQQIPIRQNVPNQQCSRNIKIDKKTKVNYISRDIDAESLVKIKQIKNIGKDRMLVIIGNGPSINEVELHRFKNHPLIDTLSINKPDQRVWPTTHWAFFDFSQIRRHENLWNDYQGYIFNSTSIKRQKQKSMQFKNLGGQGFSFDLTKGIHIGRSSVYAAMQLGLWMNYCSIYIFGCDMDPEGINGQLHFYGTNPDVDPQKRKERFKSEASFYEYAASVLSEEDKRRFTFCSSVNKWGFVDKYGKIRHETAVQHILDTIVPAES
jgi:hypothetical protein